MSGWISVDDMLPEIGDYSVIAYFSDGGIDMVHVQDYFDEITSGIDCDGNQLYSKWYISQGVTHWHPMPSAPID